MAYSRGPRRELPLAALLQAQAVAHALRRARERRGLTQKEVAQAIGVATSTVGYIERFRQIPSLDVLLLFVGYYGLDFEVKEPDE